MVATESCQVKCCVASFLPQETRGCEEERGGEERKRRGEKRRGRKRGEKVGGGCGVKRRGEGEGRGSEKGRRSEKGS